MNSIVLENIKALNKCRQSFKNKEYGSISESQFEEMMEKRFNFFRDRYPKIFEKAARGFFENPDEINRLKLAINTQNDISSGKIAEKEGGVIFGQDLVDTYVKPQFQDNNTNTTATTTHNTIPNNINNGMSMPENNQVVIAKDNSNPFENAPDPYSDSDDEECEKKSKISGLLTEIVMPTHELGAGDLKRKVKIDSDDESDDE
jgi:hypothetical protein